ncbi:MAG: hypothetical protein QXN05_03350 [Acidilobaceae archaeon]
MKARRGGPPFRWKLILLTFIPPALIIALGWAGIVVTSRVLAEALRRLEGGSPLSSCAFTVLSFLTFFLWIALWAEMSNLIISRARSQDGMKIYSRSER